MIARKSFLIISSHIVAQFLGWIGLVVLARSWGADIAIQPYKSIIKNQIKRAIKENSKFKLLPIVLMIFLQQICSLFIYYFIKNRKKKKPIIGFSNLYYNGNPKAVFEYLQKNDRYEIFWAANNIQTLKEVRKNGGKAFIKNILDGIIGLPYFLKADIWVIAHKGHDILPLPHKNYKSIQLWHAVGTKGISHTKKTFDEYDAWCVSSDYSKSKYMELWDVPSEKLYVTGFAEMDAFAKYLKTERNILLDEIGIEQNKKIILYAPTYDISLWPWKNAYEEFENLCKFCKEKNLILILRLHPYAKICKKSIASIIKNYGNVYWRNMKEEQDTMKLLAIADILITDWSSLYAHYYLAKRPIVFLDAEKEYFTKKRGGLEIPPEFRAGEIVQNNDDFYKALQTVLEKGNRFKEEQEKFLEIIHGNVDGKSSERVVKVIKKLVENNQMK